MVGVGDVDVVDALMARRGFDCVIWTWVPALVRSHMPSLSRPASTHCLSVGNSEGVVVGDPKGAGFGTALAVGVDGDANHARGAWGRLRWPVLATARTSYSAICPIRAHHNSVSNLESLANTVVMLRRRPRSSTQLRSPLTTPEN